MATFSELRCLKEERTALLKIASEFNAQLQRLKIEELALMSMVKLHEEDKNGEQNTSNQEVLDDEDMDESRLEDLDLSVSNVKDINHEGDEEEEEESEEEETDQLTMFIQDLTHRAEKDTDS